MTQQIIRKQIVRAGRGNEFSKRTVKKIDGKFFAQINGQMKRVGQISNGDWLLFNDPVVELVPSIFVRV